VQWRVIPCNSFLVIRPSATYPYSFLAWNSLVFSFTFFVSLSTSIILPTIILYWYSNLQSLCSFFTPTFSFILCESSPIFCGRNWYLWLLFTLVLTTYQLKQQCQKYEEGHGELGRGLFSVLQLSRGSIMDSSQRNLTAWREQHKERCGPAHLPKCRIRFF
jgi:hypothetical protein